MRIAQFLNGSAEVVYMDKLMRSIRVVTLIVVASDGRAAKVFGFARGGSKAGEAICTRHAAAHFDRQECSGSGWASDNSGDDLLTTVEKMYQRNIRRMTVVNSDGEAVGIISLDDVRNLLAKRMNVRCDRSSLPLMILEYAGSESTNGAIRHEV